MLKSLWIILFLFFGHLASGQVLISILLGDKLNSGGIEFGLEGGYTLSSLSGVSPSKAQSNFNLGFYFDFRLKNPAWYLSTGVRVKSTMGAKEISLYPLDDPNLDNAFAGGSITRVLGYFQVPVSMRYMFKNNVFVQGGIQLGMRSTSKDIFVNDIQEKKDLQYSVGVKEAYHPLDAGLLAGLGYRFIKGNGMNISAQYYYGLVDVRVSDTSPNQSNRALYVNVGIPIGKGKAAKAEAEKKMNESVN